MGHPAPLRVFIADDHELVRAGLARLLTEAEDVEVVGCAANGFEVLEKVPDLLPDLVLLDVSMPGKGGMDTLKELRHGYPAIRVLMLSMYPEDQYAVRLLKEGAAGYMTKESAPEELLSAIRRIHGGGRYVSPQLADALVTHLESGEGAESHACLSDREFQVMCMLASGKTVGQIADELLLSVKTVSTYRTRILQKMNLRNTAQIMHYALQKGLVEPAPT
ncbi:MAG: response regulator transcription factor [Acidobacteria bacterium]|nr:response regulator transcription factor [Acidobacteriota bacterium]